MVTLLSAPLELGGEWGGSPPNDAFAVISLMRVPHPVLWTNGWLMRRA